MRLQQWLADVMIGIVLVGVPAGLSFHVIGPHMAEAVSTAEPTPENAPRLVIEAGGHAAIIRELLFTADGRELVSVSDDKTIRIWSVSPDGRRAALVRTIRGQMDEGRAGELGAAALSPPDTEGRQQWLAVGGFLAGAPNDRYAIRLHDYASGEVMALLHGHQDMVLALAFAPNGRWLASASKDHTVRLWDLASLQGQRLTRAPLELTGHADQIYDLAWSATGDRLASASYDRTVGLWNTSQLAQGQATLIALLRGHDGQVRTVAFHPDSTVLVSAGKDQTLRLWRASDGKDLKVLARADHKVAALAFSPDGQFLLAGSDATPPKADRITLYGYPSGKVQRVFTGHHNTVFATAFHPSGQWVASGGGDHKEILLWRVPTGDILSRLEGRGETIWAVGFSADGRYLSWGHTYQSTSVNDYGPLEHRFDLSQLVRIPGGLPHGSVVRARERVQQLALAVESGGPYGYEYRLHIMRGSTRLGTIERGETNGYWHRAYTFTPNGQHVLSGGQKGVLELYTLDGKVRAKLVGHSGEIKAVAVSADGRWAVSGSVDQTLKLWSLADLPASGSAEIAPTLTLFPDRDRAWVAWTPEGFFAASAHGAELIGYNINQGLDKIAKYVAVDQLYERFYRPDLLHTRLHGDPEQLWHKEGALTKAETILTAGLPPQVMFVSPIMDTVMAQREVDVQVTLVDQGGGIGKVVWKIDGVTTAVDMPSSHGASRLPPTGGAVTQKTHHLVLMPGQNTLEVIAYNHQNEVATAPAVLRLTLAEAPALPLVATTSPPPQAPSPSSPTPALGRPAPSSEPVTPPAPAVTTPMPLPAGTGTRPPPALPPVPLTPPQDTTARPTVPVVAPLPAPSPSALPTLHLLVVGVNRYRDKALELKYAVADAQELAATLHPMAAPLFRDIMLTTLFDEHVTLSGLEATFTRIATAAQPQDVFMLYIAGHGVTRDGHYYFLPQDFRYRDDETIQRDAITQAHLQRWLASIPARKSLVLIDTCESGSFSQSLAMLRGIAEKTAIDKLTRATGRATIVAATDNQPALEGYQEHGVFTYVLLQALRQADTTHGNRDGMTSVFELAAYVDDQVPAITRQTFNFEQFPQVHMVGSDFPIGIVQQR